jgi:hypothetical protein
MPCFDHNTFLPEPHRRVKKPPADNRDFGNANKSPGLCRAPYTLENSHGPDSAPLAYGYSGNFQESDLLNVGDKT